MFGDNAETRRMTSQSVTNGFSGRWKLGTDLSHTTHFASRILGIFCLVEYQPDQTGQRTDVPNLQRFEARSIPSPEYSPVLFPLLSWNLSSLLSLSTSDRDSIRSSFLSQSRVLTAPRHQYCQTRGERSECVLTRMRVVRICPSCADPRLKLMVIFSRKSYYISNGT
jgi:hypothetical protein